ncbi:histidine phosphatase family protein [Mucilaginibacter agri]|uniref:Histidine phosphatase family protein n=1 Tax=Mucilaginibacter agri TaxID=2695265 RepID=A0A965ZJ89_9SPHI|nr:histidine phosphatase family protein [Mucilaginibacter agri]NCD71660.1 histidine phosphatase family protein [Mucilaginibacter agri]
MKKTFTFWSATFLIIFGMLTNVMAGGKPDRSNLKVVLIRHAEKPDNGYNLSCTGFNRALKLPEVLKSKFGIPNYIFVPSPSTGKQTTNGRMMQTVLPFAVKYNLAINTNYDVDDVANLVQKINTRTGTVLVVWEHKQLPKILDLLGIKGSPNLKWAPDDYDSIYIVTFPKGKKGVLTVDKENIHPTATCEF